MSCRKQTDNAISTISREASSVSADASYDTPCSPSSGTDLTEPEYHSPVAGKCQKRSSIPKNNHKSQQAGSPESDDTDEELEKVPEDYGKSLNTKSLILRLKGRWARFCRAKATEPAADPKWGDTEDALRKASPNDMHRFLNWCCKLQYNPDGRRLKGYKKASAFKADWKYFRGYYTRVTKREMDKEMAAAVRTGIRHLIDKYSMETQPRENIPVYIEDMVPFNETILQTREKRFHLGFQRINLCLYNTIGLFTVNRKQAVLFLQFKHLQISLQRDPHGGPPRPMIEIKPQFVKGVMGMRRLNTFSLPEIVYGVSLVYSPHILLFSILFYADAFEAPNLNSMEALRKLLVDDGRQEMVLPLKPEMDDYYVFPKVDIVNNKPCILWETRMTGGSLDAQLRTLSEIHGFLNHFFSHQFRYGGGGLLDQNGFVSDAQRNVIMAHASSRTFIEHYRPRRHAGLQEIMCGLNPDQEFSRAVTRMSRWIDRRRPRYLNETDRTSVEQDPELQSAVRWQSELEKQYRGSENLTLRVMLEDQEHKIKNLRRRLQERQRKRMRQDFSRKQAVIDIERQLTGVAVSDESAREVLCKEFAMPPEQIDLVQTFFTWPVSDSLEDEWIRRDKAVAAAIKYCAFPEGSPLRGRPKRAAPSDKEDSATSSPARRQKTTERSTKEGGIVNESINPLQRPLMCFQCKKQYSDHNGVKRHFRISHLKDRRCNSCDLSLEHEMHLRRHAQEIHRLCT
ncbi:hypothetical protein BDV25DRAFT_168391 [Aspergillus avenaceus]|uniref:C2H2-type domain-containing protein n=1 Tax=Aspergillus avenaceus TaxID=36643 RepID=A0A5N6TQ60_ASPAV|nr:hypothetical protein BDV25DRAFT_168391 [Aspergillus avenaceus]